MIRLIASDEMKIKGYMRLSGYTVTNRLIDAVVDSVLTVQAVPIPDNATNGDVIQSVFPDIEISDGKRLSKIYTGIPYGELIGANVDCMRDWWNEPYKRSDTE